MQPERVTFDRRFVAIALVLLLSTLMVPPLFRGAMIALAIVAAVLAALPRGTRGVVFATMVGLATGVASINLFAIGIFQGPITAEFGWSQTEYAVVTLIGTIEASQNETMVVRTIKTAAAAFDVVKLG